MDLLNKIKKNVQNEEFIDFSIEGRNFKIYCNHNYSSHRYLLIWQIHISWRFKSLDINGSHIKSFYDSSSHFSCDYNSILGELFKIPETEFKEFYIQINKNIIKEFERKLTEAKSVNKNNNYTNKSLFKISEVVNYSESKGPSRGSETSFHGFTKTTYEISQNNIEIEIKSKYEEIIERFKNLYKVETKSYKGMSSSKVYNYTEKMYNYPLTYLANRMYYVWETFAEADLNFLENFINNMPKKIEGARNLLSTVFSNYELNGDTTIISKLGIDRIYFIKFLLICLFDDYKKLKIDNIFFWNYCYFLLNGKFYYQAYPNRTPPTKFYETNEQEALKEIFHSIYKNRALIDEILKIKMDFDELELSIIDFIETKNSKFLFQIENLVRVFYCFLKEK